MRDDFVHDRNEGMDDYMHQCERFIRKDGVDFFETLFEKKVTNSERWMLQRILNKLTK